MPAWAATGGGSPTGRCVVERGRRQERGPDQVGPFDGFAQPLFVLLHRHHELTVSNARYRTVFDGNVEILDATGSAIAPDQAPTARAARGEAFESRLQVKKGRRRLGTFDVRSDALGPSDAGYTLLTVSRVD